MRCIAAPGAAPKFGAFGGVLADLATLNTAVIVFAAVIGTAAASVAAWHLASRRNSPPAGADGWE